MFRRAIVLALVGLAVATSPAVRAAVITAFYGDDDGFGIGATTVLTNPGNSNAEVGEAPFTDVALIGNSEAFSAPAFTPTGSFSFTSDGTVVGATLTLRTGAFDSGPNPVDGPNTIFLDGMMVDSAFIDGFSQANSNIIETRSIALPSSFFGILADGSVSLTGTRLSEDDGSGFFQVDFLRLDIITAQSVPEPETLSLLAIALAFLGFMRRKRVAN